MKTYENSLKILLKEANFSPKREFIDIKNALNKILACDIIASKNYPALPTAAMDGFACDFKDIKAGAKLKVISTLPAGFMPKDKIKKNECIKTFTGALMSQNTNTLIPLESVEILKENKQEFIIIKEVVSQNFAVRQIGESYKKGQILLKKGTKIDFAQICILAELGFNKVEVFLPLNIGILATGSELVSLGKSKNEAQIYNSNSYALKALCEKWGQKAKILPNIKDDENKLKKALNSAFDKFDIIISTGGVSVGEFDFMRDFVRANGEVIIDKVAIKPGRHIKIAKINGKFLFALPGFALSAMVTANLFLKPFLRKIFNCQEQNRNFAILCENFIKKGELENFSPATLSFENASIKISTKNKIKATSAVSINLLENAVLLRADKNYNIGEIVEFIQFD